MLTRGKNYFYWEDQAEAKNIIVAVFYHISPLLQAKVHLIIIIMHVDYYRAY